MATATPVPSGPAINKMPPSPEPLQTRSPEHVEFPFTASPGEVGESPTNPWATRMASEQKTANGINEESSAGLNTANGHLNGASGVASASRLPSTVTSIEQSPSPPPPGSRSKSVQFMAIGAMQPNTQSEPVVTGKREGMLQSPTEDGLPPMTPTREGYGARFKAKLKTLSSPIVLSGHKDPHHLQQTDSDREGPYTMDDEDAEESAPELGFTPSNMRQRVRRRLSAREGKRRNNTVDFGSSTPPPGGRRFHFHRSSSDYPGGIPPNLPAPPTPPTRKPSAPSAITFSRPFGSINRTMSDIPENQRGAMSEDEGRESLRRPKHRHRRRISQLTQEILHLERSESTPPGELGTQHTSASQKWNQIKAKSASLNPFKSGKTKKKSVPHVRDAQSTQLINSLSAGIRPALMVAVAQQADTHGYKRLPLLFELLKFQITGIVLGPKDSKRHDHRLEFRIDLQYGEHDRFMTWRIQRSWKDILEQHVAITSSNWWRNLRREKPPLPDFPRYTIPYLRKARGLYDDTGEKQGPNIEEDLTDFQTGHGTATPTAEDTADEGISPMGRPLPKQRPSAFQKLHQRTASVFAPETLSKLGNQLAGRSLGRSENSNKNREKWADEVKAAMEHYLQQLFQAGLRGGDANSHNRLCRFLELSVIGIRLIPEMTYHGKEGYLRLKSMAGVHRKENLKENMRTLIKAMPNQWCVVRNSYVAFVSNPNSVEIADIFLYDPLFKVVMKKRFKSRSEQSAEPVAEELPEDDEEEDDDQLEIEQPEAGSHDRDIIGKTTHQLKLSNSERILKLLSSKRTIKQFYDSIKSAQEASIWAKPHRFESYAPLRRNCWAIPLIDGEEYMWKISTAIHRAKHTIFIHDWWLSPEIYLRRPAASSQEWRLDRLLKRKADEGIKIYIILYRNVESAFNLASERTKELLSMASPNIFIQRSPHAGEQKNFLYAHHEKVLVVDYLTAFCGGIDLCFGRWDSTEHRLADNTLTGFEPGEYPRNYDYCQLWPGKDYNNPRVHDFERVEWAYEETYDRSKVPRMPWHDIGIQLAGAPARDLCRHFIQRWNYLRRRPGGDGAHHDRRRPVLLPCPDFTDREIRTMGLSGTCEAQILRSAGAWSLGIGKAESSVQTAYLAAIKESQHLVYIENQFFVTSLPDNKIYNEIGDALVERAIRAHQNNEDWRAIIMIPLLPGFAFQPRDWGATSLRMIMDMQFWSICRHEKSIYKRLEVAGVRPEDYIQFYSLRKWGEIDSKGTLVTEQLYIHAKAMVVDDRIAIIGSANINDRSMLGYRDSEIAVVVQDRASVDGTMGGKSFRKGQFAYDLRMRLMAEHLGIDYVPGEMETVVERAVVNQTMGTAPVLTEKPVQGQYATFTNWNTPQMPVSRYGKEAAKFSKQDPVNVPLPDEDDTDIGGPQASDTVTPSRITDANILELCPELSEMRFKSPTAEDISDPFTPEFRRAWDTVAANNTDLFRRVFHSQPDSLVTTTEQHAEFNEAATLFAAHQHDTERPVMSSRRPQAWKLFNDQDGVQAAPKILLKDEANQVLNLVQGHLVQWPRDWMKSVDWRKLADRIAPTAMFS